MSVKMEREGERERKRESCIVLWLYQIVGKPIQHHFTNMVWWQSRLWGRSGIGTWKLLWGMGMKLCWQGRDQENPWEWGGMEQIHGEGLWMRTIYFTISLYAVSSELAWFTICFVFSVAFPLIQTFLFTGVV